MRTRKGQGEVGGADVCLGVVVVVPKEARRRRDSMQNTVPYQAFKSRVVTLSLQKLRSIQVAGSVCGVSIRSGIFRKYSCNIMQNKG